MHQSIESSAPDPRDIVGKVSGLLRNRPLGPISRKSGDIILFVSSKRRRLEARNFAVIFIFIFIPFTTNEKTSLTQ